MDVYTTLPRVDSNADGEIVRVHFLVDGMTAFGKVWYRGEELVIQRETGWWDSTKNRFGDSWVDFTEQQQKERWGEVRFRHGEWEGDGFDLDDDALDEADRELLRRIEEDKQKAVPTA